MTGGGFQTQVNTVPAVAVAGDFASTNPRYSVLAGPGGLVAGPNGLTIGRFAWWSLTAEDANGAPQIVNNSGAGPVTGIVHREQQGLITAYLSGSGMVQPLGFGATLYSGGDFWIKNDGSVEADVGMKAYANFADGKCTFAATGSPTNAATSSASTIAAGTSSVTGSIAGNLLTVTAVGSGTVYPGTQISGTGVAANSAIVSQVSGTAGGVGTYLVNIGEQTVASTTISGTYGLLTVGGTVTGTFAVGDTVTGSGIAAGTQITALGTGTGGAGTYIVNLTQTISSQAINASANVETKWIAMSSGLPGELVKISSQPLG